MKISSELTEKLQPQELTTLTKIRNSGKKDPIMTSMIYDLHHVVTKIPWLFDKSPLKNKGGVAVTRIAVVKMAESGKGP